MNNFFAECPDGHGTFSGYLAPELPLKCFCPVCGIDMIGYRIIKNG